MNKQTCTRRTSLAKKKKRGPAHTHTHYTGHTAEHIGGDTPRETHPHSHTHARTVFFFSANHFGTALEHQSTDGSRAPHTHTHRHTWPRPLLHLLVVLLCSFFFLIFCFSFTITMKHTHSHTHTHTHGEIRRRRGGWGGHFEEPLREPPSKNWANQQNDGCGRAADGGGDDHAIACNWREDTPTSQRPKKKPNSRNKNCTTRTRRRQRRRRRRVQLHTSTSRWRRRKQSSSSSGGRSWWRRRRRRSH